MEGKKVNFSRAFEEVSRGEENSQLFIHSDEDAFPNYFENGLGLDEINDTNCEEIQFQYDFRLHQESVKAMIDLGGNLQSFIPMITYHKHVWWYYGYKLQLEKDMSLSLLLKSLGPTARPDKEVPRGAIGNNVPRNQLPPPGNSVHVLLAVKKDGNLQAIVEKNLYDIGNADGYICSELISLVKLHEIIKTNEFIILRVSINISKTYFNIKKLINSNITSAIKKKATSEEMNLLEMVLKQEKTPSSDFVFTRGSGENNDATSYHVHKNIIKRRSFVLKGIFRQKYSLPTDQLLVVHTEDRIIFPYLIDDDMDFLLTYLYTGKVILPKFNGFARVGRVISFLISPEQLVEIFMQWEYLIVMNLLEIEKQNNSNDIVEESFKALISVYSAPYGALPHAKRMAMSLLADQLTKTNENLEKYGENSNYGRYKIGHFMDSALKLKRFICSIKKMPYFM
ncbi:unnamed protein product [Thelazia callipaeda]|uniref:BTB domain-containing protein n=1 Tax=Thelazia callipaeda TaxID=103827 RepID=A0A0N5CK83_THECL|nr:unnamed protein product [Thelazia callipaeda]